MHYAGTVRRILVFTGLLAGAFAGISLGQTFTGGAVTFNSGNPGDVASKATPYPSVVAVSGLSGTFISMSLTLTFDQLQTQSFASPAILLQAPTGTSLDALSFGCGVSPTQTKPLTFTLTDSASALFSHNSQCGDIVNNSTFKPAAYAGTTDIFPSPGPGSYSVAGDGTGGSGMATFANTFGGIAVASMNGNWNLFIADQGNNAAGTHITSWSITFNVTGSNSATTTTLTAGTPNPSFTSGASSTVSFPVHVQKADNSGPATNGTVTLHDNTTATDLSTISINASGNATFSVTISTEGTHDLLANYNGGTGFAASASNHVSQTAIHHVTGPTTNSDGSIAFCNGPVSILSGNSATGTGGNPYPSEIILGGSEPTVSGVIQKLTLTLNNVQTQDPQQLGFLVQAPSGTTYEFLAWAGGTTSTIGSGINVTLSDTGGSTISEFNAPNCPFSSPCLPTDNAINVGGNDPFPSPAPALIDFAAPTGSATFAQEFGGLGASGTWKLFLANRATQAGNTGSVGQWCLNFTMQVGAHPTQTSVTASPNPQLTTLNATVTATVTVTDGSGLTPNAGTVTFVDGGTNLGTSAVNASGVAMLTTVKLSEGTHHIVASYSGTNSGTQFGISSGHVNLRFDNATTETGFAPYSYCNTGSITVPGNGADKGAAAPYPSNIFVTNLPGTVKAVTVSLKQFSTNDQNDLLSLLVGPGNANLDFFSLTGATCSGAACANTFGPVNVTFDDTAASTVNGDVSGGGLFKPTSLNAAGQGVSPDAPVAYPACPPNALDCSSPPVGPPLPSNPFTPTNKAATAGTGIFGNANTAGIFGGTSASTTIGNGTWSLYLDDAPHGGGRFSTIASGWCVNFTENPVSVAATKSHSGSNPSNHFVQGEQGAQFGVALQNNGPGSTGDPSTTNPMTVVDTLDSRFTFAGFSGTVWSCGAVAQVVTCTNHDTIAQGANYPALTINVNVSNTATPGQLTNSIAVSGGGASNTSANDSVTIDAAPVLSVTKTHTGTFTQGSTAEWDITVNNTGFNMTANSITQGTTTVMDTLPSGTNNGSPYSYTISGTPTGTGWDCSTSTTTVLKCTSTQAVAGGSSFNPITMIVNVPTTSPTSVSNTASAFGGGDLTHTNAGTAVPGTDSNVPVVQVPATITINGMQTQSANINTAYGSLAVTVKDAASVAIAGFTPVVFTATTGGSGQSGTFDNNTNTKSVAASASGIADPGTFTANGTAGSFTVGVTAGSATATFNLTNTLPFVTITLASSPAGMLVSADGGAAAAAPQTFQWVPGSMHTIATTSPQGGYVWLNWSDTGAISHMVTVPNVATTYTANFGPGPTSLGGTLTSKSGTQNARVWSFTITNPGPGIALGAKASSFTLTQTSGAACTPVVASPAFPATLGDIAPSGSAPLSVTIDFTGCVSTARFNLSVPLTANSGAATGNITRLNEFR